MTSMAPKSLGKAGGTFQRRLARHGEPNHNPAFIHVVKVSVAGKADHAVCGIRLHLGNNRVRHDDGLRRLQRRFSGDSEGPPLGKQLTFPHGNTKSVIARVTVSLPEVISPIAP